MRWEMIGPSPRQTLVGIQAGNGFGLEKSLQQGHRRWLQCRVLSRDPNLCGARAHACRQPLPPQAQSGRFRQLICRETARRAQRRIAGSATDRRALGFHGRKICHLGGLCPTRGHAA